MLSESQIIGVFLEYMRGGGDGMVTICPEEAVKTVMEIGQMDGQARTVEIMTMITGQLNYNSYLIIHFYNISSSGNNDNSDPWGNDDNDSSHSGGGKDDSSHGGDNDNNNGGGVRSHE